MALIRLDIQSLRNIDETRMNCSPGLNLILGPNASGKTSLLEAISLTCQGRSFRTARIDQLVQHDASSLLVVARFKTELEQHVIGLSRENKKTTVKIDGERVANTTSLAKRMPLFVLTPESHELLDSGPKMRRQYLDWGVFHVEHRYLEVWQKYHRILRQRNSSFRQQRPTKEIQVWDHPLAEVGEELQRLRSAYVQKLTPNLEKFGLELIGHQPKFDYYPGWDTEQPLLSLLQQNFATDQQRGFTRSGPHRADIKIKIGGKAVQTVFSRGQQKLLICAMTLAQLQEHTQSAILLIDDLPAELDPQRRALLLSCLQQMDVQVFITATEAGLIDVSSWPEHSLFHVKQGAIEPEQVV